MTKKLLKTDADAVVFLAERDIFVVDGKVTERCPRCFGKGHLGGGFGPYAWQTCFRCGGKGQYHYNPLKYARRVKSREAAAKRREAKRVRIQEEKESARLQKLAEFEALHPGLKDRLFAHLPAEDAGSWTFLQDVANSLQVRGSLSAKQVDYAVKALDKLENPEPVGQLEDGRQTIEGTVLKVKWYENDFGGAFKMTVKTDDNCRVWGTVPSSISSDELEGKRVRFDASVTVKDEGFGFFKRPTKAEVL